MVVIPEATTPEARAAAAGRPLSAKDIIDRAAKAATQGSQQVRRRWRQHRRQWRRQAAWTPGLAPRSISPIRAALLPIVGLVRLALFLAAAAALISLVNTGAVLDWQLPPDLPLWAAALLLLVGYQIVVAPLRTVHHLASIAGPAPVPPAVAFWNSVISLLGLAVVVWIASHHTSEIRDALHRLPAIVHDFVDAMRDFAERYRASDR
jgi:hypothetical protein